MGSFIVEEWSLVKAGSSKMCFHDLQTYLHCKRDVNGSLQQGYGPEVLIYAMLCHGACRLQKKARKRVSFDGRRLLCLFLKKVRVKKGCRCKDELVKLLICTQVLWVFGSVVRSNALFEWHLIHKE